MDALPFYTLPGPTEWPAPPGAYSFSSLQELSVCVRRWQLTHGRYGDLDRLPEAPGEAAEAGTLVHEALSRLLRLLSMHGLPPQGSEAFRAAVGEADLPRWVGGELGELGRRIEGHPRAATVRWRLSSQDVLNRVMHQFQLTYPKLVAFGSSWKQQTRDGSRGEAKSLLSRLSQRGLLSEEHVKHPELPLHGFIDLVHVGEGGAVIVDFKTGAQHDHHRDQLELYALLWWRATGELPSELVVRYVGEALRWSVDEARLTVLEEELSAKTAALTVALSSHPAEATTGEHCARCPGRPFCDRYWEKPAPWNQAAVGARVDAEMVVDAVGEHSIHGRLADGSPAVLVLDEGAPLPRPVAKDQRLRVLGARREPEEGALRVVQSSEVFRAAG